ncbi:hypothetical protein AB0B25_22885 [Nocardia sp. NPDC049190]|uniref:hypothetical protein n=1 Tax=Nocardia sp. NPDC049190 TaxID=3155650 RepID=UPI0033E51747
MNEHKPPGPETDGYREVTDAVRGEAPDTEHRAEDAAAHVRRAAESKAADVCRSAAPPSREDEGKAVPERRGGQNQEAAHKAAESIRRAAERADLDQANVATAGERGAAGPPEPIAHPARTLLDMVRNQPLLATAPAAILTFVVWRAFRRR